jgi:putative transposase
MASNLPRVIPRQAVFEYIETDYNPVSLHSANEFQSPIEFEVNFKQTLVS